MDAGISGMLLCIGILHNKVIKMYLLPDNPSQYLLDLR